MTKAELCLQKLRELTEIKENYPLANLTSYHIGGPAKYYCQLTELRLIPLIWQLIKQWQMPHCLLGSGSNVLINDLGYEGLVIRVGLNKIDVNEQTIVASSDISLVSLVSTALENNLSGLEFAVGIPGSTGGAVVGNAGAYGGQIADLVTNCLILNEEYRLVTLTKEQLQFSYRDSIFKHRDLLLIQTTFNLAPGLSSEIQRKMLEYNTDRWSKQPAYPSAGSVFKNIVLTEQVLAVLKKTISQEIPDQYRQYGKIPAAWLIDLAGLKGKCFGGAMISEKHANFIINYNQATSADVIQAINFIKNKVNDLFQIKLEEEIRYIGF
ncbi:MAG: UDP-N-acetylenolpyruvoylglucosamine reductase [Candidatus Komeilibacteria bacterium CG_4_10_14_0_2_um_filter_37_10]|uniref:UDP-N-acetylenolpyruvoylglucosamine reductase n=1 Tax=Candidatus Komeilibacteria bacterium CG_4_10_14_0_2_um_filter_37_10 TaxID=1974470 RepID=A0A2M7VDS5_9BACT|nr:MAG: UDP-N-acetylenolpyruvoylglucosamine reductase [Candidatus Komeilibacteria bacterium CG_4_10_14_0_2_um_filter_37_10]PJA92660.1 MAG: UDP-N-acetylenolpyruvoylglucosamine reductase [Candidatus Komeilibacteria bacterium CG_4_9_14_3_um_filter_37_5]